MNGVYRRVRANLSKNKLATDILARKAANNQEAAMAALRKNLRWEEDDPISAEREEDVHGMKIERFLASDKNLGPLDEVKRLAQSVLVHMKQGNTSHLNEHLFLKIDYEGQVQWFVTSQLASLLGLINLYTSNALDDYQLFKANCAVDELTIHWALVLNAIARVSHELASKVNSKRLPKNARARNQVEFHLTTVPEYPIDSMMNELTASDVTMVAVPSGPARCWPMPSNLMMHKLRQVVNDEQIVNGCVPAVTSTSELGLQRDRTKIVCACRDLCSFYAPSSRQQTGLRAYDLLCY